MKLENPQEQKKTSKCLFYLCFEAFWQTWFGIFVELARIQSFEKGEKYGHYLFRKKKEE